MDREAIYARLPAVLQNVVCSVEGWRLQRARYGTGFDTLLADVEQRGRWDVGRLRAFRDARISAFVRHAASTVPYYRESFRRHGIDAEGVRTLEDLAQLPIIGKRDAQDAGDLLMSDAVDRRACSPAHTSGTTGAGLRFVVADEGVREQWAVWWRYRGWHGIERGTWCGYFAGRSVVPISQNRPPFWRINLPARQILFSGYHLGPGRLPAYVEQLRQRRPPWLHGYPSLIALLAQHLIASGGDLGYQVRWVTTGAENLLAAQRELITRAFGVAPLQHYGLAEGVANMSQCDAGSLHVDEDFAAVEFLPLEDGAGYRIVGTNLSNPATPLLRYDTGDVVHGFGACTCGRGSRVVSAVDGRREDYIVLRSGSRVGRMDHVFKDLVNIREAQLRQSRIGEVTALVVRGPAFTDHDAQQLHREFDRRVGREADLRIEYVDVVPRTAGGKLRFVISDVGGMSPPH
jgi:phenylacetate-CoA ligase